MKETDISRLGAITVYKSDVVRAALARASRRVVWVRNAHEQWRLT